jgi:hypothetical protein
MSPRASTSDVALPRVVQHVPVELFGINVPDWGTGPRASA